MSAREEFETVLADFGFEDLGGRVYGHPMPPGEIDRRRIHLFADHWEAVHPSASGTRAESLREYVKRARLIVFEPGYDPNWFTPEGWEDGYIDKYEP